jgi:hypothetical protein
MVLSSALDTASDLLTQVCTSCLLRCDDARRDNSIQALAEYVIYPSACLFIYSLKHDLESVYGTIVVESLVL